MEYKFKATTQEEIYNFLNKNEIQWDGIKTPLSFIDGTFVFLGQVIISYEPLAYLDDLHFDILTDRELILTDGIVRMYPHNPKHTFGEYVKPIE